MSIPTSADCNRFLVANGEFVPDEEPVKIGVSGRYRCSQEYTLIGNSERVCTISKQWSGQPSVCVESIGEHM